MNLKLKGLNVATESEKLKILNMVASGKISAAQGVELIDACCVAEQKAATAENGQEKIHSAPPQWVRVVVTDLGTGRKRVNLRMPAALVSSSAKFGAHLSIENQSFNTEFLRESIRNRKWGKILDIADDDEHERVEIILE